MTLRKKSFLELGTGIALFIVFVFFTGCYGFVASSTSCGPCRFIYDYQTLIAGVLALLAAVLASALVYEQIRVARTQSAVMSRDVLIQRLRTVGARKKIVAALVAKITHEFEYEIYPNPEGGKMEVNAHWAHSAEQEVSSTVSKLKRIRTSRSDPDDIQETLENLILVATQLGECLYYIPIPVQRPWENAEHIPVDDYPAHAVEADRDAKRAEQELPGKITAVRRAGEAVGASYSRLLESLRKQLRKIDDSILSTGLPG